MAKPPAGSSLLFAALADSGRIKERKNGSYRMVLKGVDEIDWFTDRPDRVAGEWSPKKLVKKWDCLFGGVEPNAQMSYTWKSFIDFAGPIEGRGNISFEMFKPTASKRGNKLTFNVKGIGKKNKEIIAGLADDDVYDVSLFIDDATNILPECLPDCRGEHLVNANLTGADFTSATLDGIKWNNTTCPDGTMNVGISPCTAEQLNLA